MERGQPGAVAAGEEPLSPGSSADTGVCSASDDMMESDMEMLRDRISSLEKRVVDQNDEIVCLRATLADVLRRINQIEGGPRGSISTPSKELTRVNSSPGTADRFVNGSQRDLLRRPSSSVSHQNPSIRRSAHYQSTGSLMSDSPSSSSASPAPSPSPVQQAPPPQPAAPSTPNGSAGTPGRKGNLHTAKKWSSTSDFAPIGQQQAVSSSSLAARRKESGSLVNLNSARSATGGRHGTKDAIFDAENGYVKFYLRGRPVLAYAPTNQIESYSLSKVNMAPSSKLKMEWVYGYRGRDCRSNLHLLPTGEMVYFIAAVVVLHNVEEHQQRHYLGHTDDVKCMAVHPNKLLIASGQSAGHDKKEGKSHVRIWNSVSLQTLHVIGLGDFEKTISCLAFSKADGGNLLAVIDDAPDQNLSIWDWHKGDRGQKIVETKCSMDLVVGLEFHPMERYTFVTCGKSHVCFWSLEGGSITRRLGYMETRDKPKYVTCLAFADNGDVLTGDSSGNVFVWAKGSNTVHKMLRNAHEGPVFSLLVLKDGMIVSGGGKDGQLVLWDPAYRRTGYVAELPEQYGNVRTLAQGKGNQILAGTTRNCILAGNFDLPFVPLVTGHTDELWALCTHPNQNQFISGGHDRLLQLWDTMSCSMVWSKDVRESIQSACFSPDGSLIVVGTTVGKWLAIDAETREICATHTDGTEPLQVVRFSPNGQYLAVGSRDNIIYVYTVSENMARFSRIGKCTGHSSFVTHLDWSTDSVHFRTNSGDYEILYWNAGICRQITHPSHMRDVEWSTQTCTLSFATLGIWPEGADGTDINTCARSHSQQLLATGDDLGKVKLFTYPASQPKALHHSYVGHSSHVTGVYFLHDDTRLVTAGGRDSALVQWTVQ